MSVAQGPSLFRLDLTSFGPAQARLLAMVEKSIGRLLALHKLEDIYARAGAGGGTEVFLQNVLDTMAVSFFAAPDDFAAIPQSGPTIVVANHPFGGLEGIVLAYHLIARRPDVKIMANYLLGRVPELRDLFILVDPFNETRSISNNVGPLREAIRWVEDGGLLAMFPAGEVAHLKIPSMRVSDPAWNPVVARIASKTDATVVPVHFRGRNSALFQIAGLIHPRLRTALLPRELANKQGMRLGLAVGGPIAPRRYRAKDGLAGMTEYFRLRTQILGCRSAATEPRPSFRRKRRAQTWPEAIAAPQRRELVLLDVATLPSEQTLLVSGDFRVFWARRRQIPSLMNEIGRLREICFRQVGEGTGQSRDLDRFDDHYLHLCLWDQKAGELAGGYRLGQSDEILARHGVGGFYTSTLFNFSPDFFGRIPHALEMGRSFITDKHQRSYSALLLLWKGIGHYIKMNPRYRYLFGPVSVSSVYTGLSRQLMMDFLARHRRSDLSGLVSPRNPADFGRRNQLIAGQLLPTLADWDEVSEVVADIERNRTAPPILFKQYLKLAAKSCGWNLDPAFNNALDCLLVADLMEADAKTMQRYGGADWEKSFRFHHAPRADAAIQRCA
ncbi:MAG: lysophospholipid acyltransferase family protein [Thermodesulfobacteriota bacterium]